MNRRRRAKEALDQALRRLGSPSIEEMESARERVRQSLRREAAGLPAETRAESLDARPVSLWRLRRPHFVPTAAVLGRLGTPSIEEMEFARERVRQALRSRAEGLPSAAVAESLLDTRPVSSWKLRYPHVLVGASLLALTVLFLALLQKTAINTQATVESADGSLYRVSGGTSAIAGTGARIKAGETVRSEAGATLALMDGSRVELRSHSEMALQNAEDGVLLQLAEGSIIVSAMKRRTGHLYVRTKDFTVSVGGTVFLVRAEEAGSRVAVIQGEVQVREGETSKKLLPGEQVATGPLVASAPVIEEISWSRDAAAYLALLQQSSVLSQ